jgi:hypothetical protein
VSQIKIYIYLYRKLQLVKLSYFPKHVSIAGLPILKKFIGSVSHPFQIVENDLSADAAIIWSVLWKGNMQGNQQIYRHFTSQKKPVVILETGNLIRGKTFKVCVNNINGTGIHAIPENIDHLRSERFKAISNVFAQGDYILICSQQEESLLWRNQPKTSVWLENIVAEVRGYSERPIIIRPHPRQNQFTLRNVVRKFRHVTIEVPKKLPGTDSTDFLSALKKTWCVVGHNSGSLIESAVRSLPVYCDKTSLCFPVSQQDLSKIDTAVPKTSQDWLNFIYHTEWFEEEIAQGIPWAILNPIIKDLIEKRNS